MYPRRRAISPVVSTIIITAATLVLVIGILSYANNLFNSETENAEFSQAQNIFGNFADEIDSVAMRQGASAYVALNTKTGGVSWYPNYDKLSVSVNILNQSSLQNYTILAGNLSALQFKAGLAVGAFGFNIIRGVNYSGIINNQYPLGRVFTAQSHGAIVQLDYDRIGITDLGLQNVSTGVVPNGTHTAFDYFEFMEINLVNLTFGGVQGGSSYITATNTLLNVTYLRLFYNRTATTYPASYTLEVNVTSTANPNPNPPYYWPYLINIPTGSVMDGDGPTLKSMPVDVVIAIVEPQISITYLG